jgi:hypothetical protein
VVLRLADLETAKMISKGARPNAIYVFLLSIKALITQAPTIFARRHNCHPLAYTHLTTLDTHYTAGANTQTRPLATGARAIIIIIIIIIQKTSNKFIKYRPR